MADPVKPTTPPAASSPTPEQLAAEKKKQAAEFEAIKEKALAHLAKLKDSCKEYVGKKNFNPFLLSTKVDALGKKIANRGNLLPEEEVKKAVVDALALEFDLKHIKVTYEEPAGTQKQINPAENKLILPPKE